MPRLADGPVVEVWVSCAASPEQLWPLISDIELPARFSDEFVGATWLDAPRSNGEHAVGDRFEGRNEHAAIGSWKVTCTVEHHEVNHLFGWLVGDAADPIAHWCLTTEEADPGSRVRFRAQLGPGRSGLTPMVEARPEAEEAIVAMRMDMWRANMEATLAGIVALAEQA